ncbi:MAG TPA: hypothetical protein VGL77_12580 [Armatimonadota bacterium]
MPIFRAGAGQAPAWCELERFELIALQRGERRQLPRTGQREHLIVCRGLLQATSGATTSTLPEGGQLELTAAEAEGYSLTALNETLVFHAAGHWGSITSSGIFTARPGTPPTHDTPYPYAKTTTFDNHYHDCDEYWIILDGHCRAVSEGQCYDVAPGDCIVTGMGWHHDVASIEGEGPLKGVWFEGTLEGQKRVGHLWEPQHGPAEPKPERM